MSTKRNVITFPQAFDGPVSASIFQKKARNGAATNALEQPKEIPHDDLAQDALDRQSQLASLSPPPPRMTEEDGDAKVSRLRNICAKEIKKQAKWQPSCKKGSTK